MPQRLEFLFDFASPYSYLAQAQLDDFAAEHDLEIEAQPIYLRGLELFSQGVPYPPKKLGYIHNDLMRTARLLGLPYQLPASFPVNGLYLLRGALWLEGHPAEKRYHQAAWAATWAEGKAIGTAEEASAVAQSVGLDPAEFQAGIADPAIKERLKDNTARASERGVFGVPSFFAGEELFWGQDRLPLLAKFLEEHASPQEK